VSWSDYWVERARSSAEHQRLVYGLEVPRSLNSLLDRERPRLGLAASVHVLAFVFFWIPPRRTPDLLASPRRPRHPRAGPQD